MAILQLACYILNTQKAVTHLKLQKLLYYLKVWGLVSGNQVISEDFIKWKHGPVNKKVYDAYKKYGYSSIPKCAFKGSRIEHKEFVDFILECYGPYDAITLSAMTHQDAPWKETPPDSIISNQSIMKYYSSLPFARNFPFDPQKPFYPVQSNLHYAFIFDMDEKTINETMAYPSYIAYKKQEEKAKDDVERWISILASPSK
jgi:uncharacterized phage-associated protein